MLCSIKVNYDNISTMGFSFANWPIKKDLVIVWQREVKGREKRAKIRSLFTQ